MRSGKLYAEDVPEALLRRFRKRLIDDGLSYRAWLIGAIRLYLSGGGK